MFRFLSLRSQIIGAFCTATIALTAVNAEAQHLHFGGHHSHWGHGHRGLGHFHWHNGHLDYHPGHVYPRRIYTPSYPVYDDHAYDDQSYPEHRVEYRFGGFSHIDDLAASLESQANLLCWEMYYNYQHNPGYRSTYREVYEISQVAKFIHGLEHAHNRERIREEVLRLDRLFHHVQRDVVNWTGHHHRHVGRGGLTSKLESFEETLHHLMDDVGVRSAPAAEGEGGILDGAPAAPPADGPAPLAQP
jgi:hypothetical protein